MVTGRGRLARVEGMGRFQCDVMVVVVVHLVRGTVKKVVEQKQPHDGGSVMSD